MSYLLDTDHISLIHRQTAEGRRIEARLSAIDITEVFLSIVSFEEQSKGWNAALSRKHAFDKQEVVYAELAKMLEMYCSAALLQFNSGAIDQFQKLWLTRPRIGTMDLKIASIALANNATLLTRNTRDFEKVPGLRIEDWSV